MRADLTVIICLQAHRIVLCCCYLLPPDILLLQRGVSFIFEQTEMNSSLHVYWL